LLQATVEKEQAAESLSDLEAETDEMFQNTGKKGNGTVIHRIRFEKSQ
jgi:hypothetical protein